MNTAVYNGSGKSVEAADTFIFKEKKATVRVYCADIVFFESCGHYVNVHMKNGKVYSTRCTMTSLAQMLDKKRFVRVHRGITVNLKYVHTVNNTDISLKSIWGRVPVSRSYKGKLEEAVACFKNNSLCIR